MVKKSVIVTGANGYLGRHVVKALLNMGHQVYAMDIKTEDVDDRAVKIQGNIFANGVELYNQVNEPDVCIHLAWRDGFVHSSPNHMGDLSKHFMFIKGMLDAGLKQIVVMGSMHEIGYWEGEIDEKTPTNPLSQYGVAKDALRRSLELLVSNYDNVIFQWTRGFYITGDDNMNQSVFSKIMQAAQDGKKTFPFTSGKNKYDFIDIELLAKQIAGVASQKEITGIINCCSGIAVSLGEKAEEFIASKKLDICLEYGAYPDRKYDSPEVWGNSEKIHKIMSLIENYQI